MSEKFDYLKWYNAKIEKTECQKCRCGTEVYYCDECEKPIEEYEKNILCLIRDNPRSSRWHIHKDCLVKYIQREKQEQRKEVKGR